MGRENVVMTPDNNKRVIEISGAGPAGLAAALAICRMGKQARVYERRADVGQRFHGDFQGLENWTKDIDVLDELAEASIQPDFEYKPFREITAFDPDGNGRLYKTQRPLFYLVRRGNQSGTIDSNLKQQALKTGVEIRFDQALHRLPNGGIVTEGPHRADAIVVGYLFETDMADGVYAAVSDRLAAKGYAYLLIWGGRGTLASCLFADFHNENRYLERCAEFFTEKVGVQMQNPRRFGGSANFFLPRTARKGNILYAGEAAGFQDPLFGFGMRSAMLSGAAAGRALVNGKPEVYEQYWNERLRPYQQTAATNRWIYNRLGDKGYRAIMHSLKENQDAAQRLQHAYAPRWWKRILYYLFTSKHFTPLLNPHEGCDCTWCRCQK
jgi:flavin-dependent dehydrogenase